MAQRTSQSKLGLNQPGQPRRNTLVAEYDFATEGGAVGDIVLRGDTLPNGARVVDVDIITETAVTSAGAATLALKSEAAADLQSALVLTGAPWTAGVHKADKFDADVTRVSTTADRAITGTVATAALTAGKFKVLVHYWMLA